eukprot:9980707-Lingulodinium_polyedra.AAC.1
MGRGTTKPLNTREAPPVVGARRHELATGANVAEANARRELDDPISGVAEHCILRPGVGRGSPGRGRYPRWPSGRGPRT